MNKVTDRVRVVPSIELSDMRLAGLAGRGGTASYRSRGTDYGTPAGFGNHAQHGIRAGKDRRDDKSPYRVQGDHCKQYAQGRCAGSRNASSGDCRRVQAQVPLVEMEGQRHPSGHHQ